MKLEQSTSQVPSQAADVCFLMSNTWDDFGFKTMFKAFLFDAEGERYDLGFVRIMKAGMSGGRVQISLPLAELDESYCSLGTDREYYVKLHQVPYPTRLTADEYLLHPYFDSLPEIPWLFADMTFEAGGPVLKYRIELDSRMYGNIATRLSYHFHALHLGKRF